MLFLAHRFPQQHVSVKNLWLWNNSEPLFKTTEKQSELNQSCKAWCTCLSISLVVYSSGILSLARVNTNSCMPARSGIWQSIKAMHAWCMPSATYFILCFPSRLERKPTLKWGTHEIMCSSCGYCSRSSWRTKKEVELIGQNYPLYIRSALLFSTCYVAL